ncbi:MAG TPA: sterol desaturase family protein [Ohtaekwangia sp.]|nr:sterol desaturase family protein [Ohtaekwangia sp.]
MMQEIIHHIIDKKGVPVLIGIFIVLFLAESLSQLRLRKGNRTRRMMVNSIVAIPGFLSLRLLLLPAMVFIAYENEDWRIGINYLYELPWWLEMGIAFLLLDYTNYLWHILNHKIPFLWRFHLVHHTDVDLDVTTAIRFHAGEMITSVFFRGLAVFVIGASPVIVLVYEIFFEAATQFHHSNWKLPFKTEKFINRMVVTPRMHGIHHSIIKDETDSNYSVIFSFWDRLHSTINLNIPQKQIVTGVPAYDNPDELTIGYLLKLPFTKIRKWNADAPSRGKENKNDMQP